MPKRMSSKYNSELQQSFIYFLYFVVVVFFCESCEWEWVREGEWALMMIELMNDWMNWDLKIESFEILKI